MSVHQQFTDPKKALPLTFGIYAGSIIGDGDDPVHIRSALDRLQGASPIFLVRGYEWYVGAGKRANLTPPNLEYYVSDTRKLDFALCYRDPEGDVEGWLECIRATIRRYGSSLAVLQIAEEPNNPDAAMGGDGALPHVAQSQNSCTNLA